MFNWTRTRLLNSSISSFAFAIAAATCTLNCDPASETDAPSDATQLGEGGAPDNTGGEGLSGSGGTGAIGGSATGHGGDGSATAGHAGGGATSQAGASGAATAGQASGGHASSGGTTATGGSTSDAGAPTEMGGSPSETIEGEAGSSGDAGAGNEPEIEFDSICTDEFGEPIPYDFSFGLASEYAFELSMNCDLGGYLMPLVIADPETLSEVNAFVMDTTDWYRSAILRCEGETQVPEEYALLPKSQIADMSSADFDLSSELFFSILDRHDSQPDAVHPNKKNKIKERIKSFKGKAVNKHTDELTKPLSEPECVPSPQPGG